MARKSGVKHQIRKVLRKDDLMRAVVRDDHINALTNRLYKRVVRPLLAKAYNEGFYAGKEYPGECGDGCYHINPYGGDAVRPL